ncbi:PAS domain S-box protein [Ideonella azotifigens]|nr:PAS domain S-box protein [Ideonella azotifigens]MCD2342156.1 PAS domain S-box protein [Ideonella azotifigens]
MSFKSKLLPSLRAAPESAGLVTSSWTGAPLPPELLALLEINPLALLACDSTGRIACANAPMQALMGVADANQLGALSPALCELIGWPGAMPGPGQSHRMEGWLPSAAGGQRHLRATTRALDGVPRRWLVQLEDCKLEDAQELSRIEIAALMGTAGLGVATFDPARGWITAAPGRPDAGEGMAEAAPAGQGAGLMSIGRDLVEPESLPEYERLQSALRQRQRVEVRYAVRHRDMGRRWLLTRVEPTALGDDGRHGFSVVTLDVTEEENARRRNEQLLQELGTILDTSPAGIAYLRGPRLARCNARFEALLDLAPGDGTGLSMDALLARCGVTGTAARQALATLAQQGSFETQFQPASAQASGKPVWYSLALRRAGVSGPGQDEAVAVLTDVTRLRTQQAELEGLERERELMFSLSDVGIVHQREGRIERANQAMAELTGHSQAELQGLPLAELYEDERVYQHHLAQEKRDLALHGRARGERRIRRRDGTELWVQVSQRPVDANDPTAGAISSFVSVDERRRARESLLAQADRTRAILDSVLVGIVTLGEKGIEWMNRSARRMFGGELSDFLGQPISVVASPEADHPLRRTDWLATLQEGQAETFECRLVGRDGRTFWVVGNAVVTGLDQGGGQQLTFALLDIERRREAENQITQARTSLQRIIETAPLAIALFDANNQQVLQLNQMMAAFARRPAAEILGRQPALWLPGPEAASLSADLHRAQEESLGRLKTPSPPRGAGWAQPGPGGAPEASDTLRRELHRAADPESGEPGQVWDMRIVSLVDPGEAGAQLLLVASDVTEQRAADEARLEAAIAQREMLVKEVHHRIKNNLQGVAGLLQQSAQRTPAAGPAIAEAVSQVHAIAQVHGLQVGMTGPLRVRGVMEAIAQSVQRMFGRQIEVEVQGPAPHRFALTEADSIPVALTVNELLTNAIKHSEGGVIVCRMICGEAEVSLCVLNPGRLAPDFSLAQIPSGISGLGLVRALLPRKGATISLTQEGEAVVARLRLVPPAVALLEPL